MIHTANDEKQSPAHAPEKEVMLGDHFFSQVSWQKAHQLIKEQQRDVMGMSAAQSDLVWRYFLKQSEENQDLSDFLDLRRAQEEQAL